MFLYIVMILLAWVVLRFRHPEDTGIRHAYMLLGVFVFATWGAKAFHVILEGGTWEDGRVFYGALAFGALASWLVIRDRPKERQFEYWNSAFLLCALGYGVLRINCFIDGCCWGSLTDSPWAVVYMGEDSAMPFKGIPVHPVQLYDSFAGFLIFGLLYFYRSRLQGNAILGFLILYPIARFITELFRGDSIRGVNVIGPLSTSQVLSLAILAGVLIYFAVRLFRSATYRA